MMKQRNITTGISPARETGRKTPLAQDEWEYVDEYDLEKLKKEDWALLGRQRKPYEQHEKHTQALEMLLAQKDVPSFGYQINIFEHCLQSATLALNDNRSVDTIVVALFHDLGFMVCNETHGDFAAELLRPYVPEKHIWMLRRHMYFQFKYCPAVEGLEYDFAQRWKDNAYFEWADEFVYKYDVTAMNADFKNAPIEEFIPLVKEVFSRPPKSFEPE